MYFKCILEDGTELYKDLNDSELVRVLNEDSVIDLLGEHFGREIISWEFTEKPVTYENVIEVDLRNAIEKENPELLIDDKKVTRLELIEGSTYEHSLVSLSLDNPKNWTYSRRIEVDCENDYDDYEEYSDGGYNDE